MIKINKNKLNKVKEMLSTANQTDLFNGIVNSIQSAQQPQKIEAKKDDFKSRLKKVLAERLSKVEEIYSIPVENPPQVIEVIQPVVQPIEEIYQAEDDSETHIDKSIQQLDTTLRVFEAIAALDPKLSNPVELVVLPLANQKYKYLKGFSNKLGEQLQTWIEILPDIETELMIVLKNLAYFSPSNFRGIINSTNELVVVGLVTERDNDLLIDFLAKNPTIDTDGALISFLEGVIDESFSNDTNGNLSMFAHKDFFTFGQLVGFEGNFSGEYGVLKLNSTKALDFMKIQA